LANYLFDSLGVAPYYSQYTVYTIIGLAIYCTQILFGTVFCT